MDVIVLAIAALAAAGICVWIIGRIRAAPQPKSLSDASIAQRLHSEQAWLMKYSRLPYSNRQSRSLKAMYDSKTKYVENLRAELQERQPQRATEAVQSEMTPILQRAAALMHEGKSFDEAKLQALREWAEKAK